MENEQTTEVDYNKELVEDYKKNYIMDEEGIGAFDDVEPYDIQTNVNVPLNFEDINEEGEVTIDEVEEVVEDDTNN